MGTRRFDRHRFRASAARRLSAIIELLFGTTRPYGRTLRTLIEESLDPRHVVRPEVPQEAEHPPPDRAAPPPRDVDSLVSLGRYEDGLGALVASAKYEAWPLPLELLGRRLGVEVAASVDWSMRNSRGVRHPVIVPIPTNGWRRWHRGMDHTRVLARGVASELGLPVRRHLRCRWSPAQVELDAVERCRAGERFRVRPSAASRLRSAGVVFLVDDVCTTGATLAAVASMLRNHGVGEIHAVVVARGSVEVG